MTHFDPDTLQRRVESLTPATLQEACAGLSLLLFEALPEMVLVRIFAVIPLDSVDPFAATFARRYAERAGTLDRLRGDTPVLTLMGTQGLDRTWCDRTRSSAHAAIPLVSSEFVETLPMLSRVVTQLKLGADWLDRTMSPRLMGNRQRTVFHVAEPHSERDGLGRLVIPRQEFVAAHQVRTVFGLGVPGSGQAVMLLLIAFSRCRVSADEVQKLAPAFLSLRSITRKLTSRGRLFPVA